MIEICHFFASKLLPVCVKIFLRAILFEIETTGNTVAEFILLMHVGLLVFCSL
jgi:hypothetical protein